MLEDRPETTLTSYNILNARSFPRYVMTIVVKNPLSLLTKNRILAILLIIATASAIAGPVTLNWAVQRSEIHARWDMEIDRASDFAFQMEYATALMNGTLYKWDNATSSFAGNLMGYANANLAYLGALDTAHLNQLYRIRDAINSVRLPFGTIPFTNISYAQRHMLAGQLYSIADKVLSAYGSLLKYTSVGGGVGPPFWYSGPSPPDESLLTDALNIALTLQTPT